MPSVFFYGLSISGLAWPFKMVPGNHTATIRLYILKINTWSIRPIKFKQHTQGDEETLELYVQQLTRTAYFFEEFFEVTEAY
jgi:hypothetical protein